MGIGNERGIELFKRAGALKEGHFRLTNGNDGIHYVAKDLLRENDDDAMREICMGIAQDFANFKIDTVIGPESGAVKYAQYTAMFLSELTGRKVVAIRARKSNDGQKQFYIDEQDLRWVLCRDILIAEDIFTTGKSAAKVVDLSTACGGNVVGVGGVWNRGAVTAEDLGVEVFIAQINRQYPTFEPGEDCPGCRNKVLYDMQFGHGKSLVGTHPLAIAQ
ncbi:hypothetical protein HN784_01700 [bacterium]|jgi:orotate phosphoribosyltransferase|nr:hypothetical protein [bacterium]MBT4250977.1 hypothetical protein [bacterium]MBT4597835.1 hypothetical protein [bacterium]MBT6753973.1 hypothetical protein [bacterium]MBT7037402.1 hypothetical protein [bacterium]